MQKPSGAVFISSIYLAFGFLWIFFSDRILLKIIADQDIYARIQTWKGWIYVLLTTILIYLLMKAYITRKNHAISNLVKNNLQMLCSLIRLKKSSMEDIEPPPLLEKIEEQLHAISLIHEKIFINNQGSFIKMKLYIEDLSASIQLKYGCKNIRLIQDIDDSQIPIDTALPYGIIISEILSNAFRHGFEDESQGIIHIDFSTTNVNYYLCIEDNGCGYDTNAVKTSFGLDLVQILSEQLGAELSIRSSPGATAVTITKALI